MYKYDGDYQADDSEESVEIEGCTEVPEGGGEPAYGRAGRCAYKLESLEVAKNSPPLLRLQDICKQRLSCVDPHRGPYTLHETEEQEHPEVSRSSVEERHSC